MNKLSLAVICALGLGMTAVSAEEADVVVVGSGGAGLSAAVTAAQAGKNVIVLEKCRLSAATRSEPKAV